MLRALNINRLIPHIDFLENDIYAKQSKIVAVTETWLEPHLQSSISSPLGHFSSASVGAGRGIGAFTKTFIHACSVIDINFQCVISRKVQAFVFLKRRAEIAQSL